MTKRQFGWTLTALLLACFLTFLVLVVKQTRESGTNPHIDFTVFWGAARLALAGETMAAFDWRALEQAQGIEPGGAIYLWHYPPSFHMLIAPLGLLPFELVYAVFTMGGLLALFLALRAWSAENGWIALASPAVLLALMVGNTSLLWAAALLAAFRVRPALGGAFLALMTTKPQLGLIIPVALVAAGAWPLLVSGALWTAALVALTLLLFGAEYWSAFFSSLSDGAARIAGGKVVTLEMVSWYAWLRAFSAGHAVALGGQALGAALAVLAVALAWRRDDRMLRMAVLCLGILLCTPYAFQYELVLASLAAMFIAASGRAGTVAGLAVILLLWLLPAWSWIIGGVRAAHYTAPMVTLSLAWLMLGAGRTRWPRVAPLRRRLDPRPPPSSCRDACARGEALRVSAEPTRLAPTGRQGESQAESQGETK